MTLDPTSPVEHVPNDGTTPPPSEETSDSTSPLRTLTEWLAVVATALVIALSIKAFVVQAFEIPSGSMATTLNINDRILVNKLSYQFGSPERGNLVVFTKLPDTQSDTNELIKRVIAMPGETLELRDDGRLWIYGPGESSGDAEILDEPYLEPRHRDLPVPRATDTPDQNIWHPNCINPARTGERCTLDESSYFVMGDNRSASTDSRAFGPVPEAHLVGRAFVRIWPPSEIGGLG